MKFISYLLFAFLPLCYLTLLVVFGRIFGGRIAFLSLAFATPVIFTICLTLLKFDPYGVGFYTTAGLFFATLLLGIFGVNFIFRSTHTRRHYVELFCGLMATISPELWVIGRIFLGIY